MKIKLLASLAALASASSLFGGSVVLSDIDFTFNVNGIKLADGLYEVRWGTYSAGVFTPLFGNTDVVNNGAYMDTASPELLATFSAGDNNAVAAGAALALSLSTLADDSSYALANASNQVVLTDPSWVAGTFTLIGPDLSYNFTSQTTVALLTGQNAATSYNFGAGNQVINLVTVPEPSTYAALAGLMVLGAVATRRRRSA